MKHAKKHFISKPETKRPALLQLMEMSKDSSNSSKKHFMLVHGGCHGAWCWYKLITLIEKAGHKATAIDLAGCGINPKQIDDVKSFHDYVQPLMETMAMLPPGEKVVLVGHSFGGVVLSRAMEAFPDKISVAVFATAIMPSPNLSSSEIFAETIRRGPPDFFLDSTSLFEGPENNLTTVSIGTEFATSMMYQNCASEDLKLATMLFRPAKMFLEELDDKSMFTNDKVGSVPRVYVVCKEDNLMKEDIQRWIVDKASGCKVMEIDGSDHMVMLSKPEELLHCLLEVAKNHV